MEKTDEPPTMGCASNRRLFENESSPRRWEPVPMVTDQARVGDLPNAR